MVVWIVACRARGDVTRWGFGEYVSMKSRETLIRLRKFQVDEKRRRTVQMIDRAVAPCRALHTADADLVGNGTLALDSKALAGRVDISLSEALSAQAGRDLVRYTREANRVVLPASIGGTLDRPRVTIDTAAALQRGLKNEVQRRLGDLLDRFKRGKTAPEP